MSYRWAWGSWVIGVFVVSGCSGSDGGGGGGGGAELSPADFCQSVGARYCAQDKPCCATLNLPFNEAACELQFSRYCLKGAQAVARGTATLVQQNLDECIQTSQPFYDKCQLSNADFMALRSTSTSCSQYFKGSVPPNGACVADADCDQGPYGALCEAAQCAQIPALTSSPELGEACSADCDQGLVCSGADPSDGVCAAGPPVPIVTADECSGALMF